MTVTNFTAEFKRSTKRTQPRIYVYPENESVYENFFNRRVRPVSVMKQVALKALRDRGFDIEAADIVWQQKAGCTCGCSPAFVLTRKFVDWKDWHPCKYQREDFIKAFEKDMAPDSHWYGSWGTTFNINIRFDGPKVRPEAQAAADEWKADPTAFEDIIAIPPRRLSIGERRQRRLSIGV